MSDRPHFRSRITIPSPISRQIKFRTRQCRVPTNMMTVVQDTAMPCPYTWGDSPHKGFHKLFYLIVARRAVLVRVPWRRETARGRTAFWPKGSPSRGQPLEVWDDLGIFCLARRALPPLTVEGFPAGKPLQHSGPGNPWWTLGFLYVLTAPMNLYYKLIYPIILRYIKPFSLKQRI